MNRASPLLPSLLCLLAAGAVACHLDGLLITPATDQFHFRPPEAPPTTLIGQFAAEGDTGVAGASVELYQADGSRFDTTAASVGDDGAFRVVVPGSQSFANLRLRAVRGSVVLMGLVPLVPHAAQVYDLPQVFDIGAAVPAMRPIDEVATTLTLLVEGKARRELGGLRALSPEAAGAALEQALGAIDEPPFSDVRAAVARLLVAAAAAPAGTPPVLVEPDAPGAAATAIDPAFLEAVSVDIDGDGTPDRDPGAFERLLDQAALAMSFDPTDAPLQAPSGAHKDDPGMAERPPIVAAGRRKREWDEGSGRCERRQPAPTR